MHQVTEIQRRGVERLANVSRELLQGLPQAQALQQSIAHLQQQWQELDSNRGMKELTIGFVGPKNHGKSFLLRLLLSNPEQQQQIRVGVGRSGRTDRLVWVGRQRPEPFDELSEQFIQLQSEGETQLRHVVTLVDVPGFTESNVRAQQVSQRAITSCQLKLLVVKSNRVEDAILGVEALKLDGSPILPILNGLEYPLEADETRILSDALHQLLSQHAPNSTILQPLPLPRLRSASNQSTEADVRRLLIERLDRVIDELAVAGPRPSRQVAVQLNRCKGELRSLLVDFIAKADAIEGEYQQRERVMEQTLFKALFANERLESSAIRLALREQLVHKTPMLLFPYRSVTGLLSLTSGAWDRLALGMAGSLPSLALTTFSTRDNRKRLTALQQERSETMLTRLTEEAARELQDSWQDYGALLQSAGVSRDPLQSPQVQLHGLSGLQLAYRQILERCSAASVTGNRLSGTVATLLFWGMLSGPLYGLYRQYFAALLDGYLYNPATNLTTYPDPGVGVLLFSMLLALLPMLLIGATAMAATTSGRKVAQCRQQIEVELHQEFQQRLQDRRLHFGLQDPHISELRWLLGYLREEL